MTVTWMSTCEALPSKPGASDHSIKSTLPPSSVVTSKDLHCKMVATNGGSELPPIAVEERSSGSSQSQNNSQSFSSNQAKTMVSSLKEEARS